MLSVDVVRARIRAARSVRELAAIRDELAPRRPFVEDLWRKRVALCASLDELSVIERAAHQIDNATLRDRVCAAAAQKRHELVFVANAQRAAASTPPLATTPLAHALAQTIDARGARAAITQFLAQRDALYPSTRSAFREAFVSFLAAVYPREFPSRTDAERALALAEEDSVRAR